MFVFQTGLVILPEFAIQLFNNPLGPAPAANPNNIINGEGLDNHIIDNESTDEWESDEEEDLLDPVILGNIPIVADGTLLGNLGNFIYTFLVSLVADPPNLNAVVD